MTGPTPPAVLLAAHLAELIEELQPLLAGALLREVQALPPRDALLIFEPAGAADGPAVLRLRLSANPDAARAHLQQGRVLAHDGPVGPFFQELGQELAGATLRGLEQVRKDRILLLEFAGAPNGRRALLVELVGRHANMVLLGPDDRVLAILVPSRGAPDKGRRLVVGQPWSAPGGTGRGPSGAVPPLAESFPEPGQPPPGRDPARAPLSWRVEVALGEQAAVHLRQNARKKLLARTQRKLRGARSLLHGLEARQTAAQGAERLRQDGELLKATMGQLRRGMTSIEVTDWFADEGETRRLELDSKLTPQENVERYFHRYRKLQRAKDNLGRELELARSRLAALQALLDDCADDSKDPIQLDAQAVQARLLDPPQEGDPRKRRPPDPRLPYKVFEVSGGHQVRVGRTAKDNDALTFRHARGNDLWLHTADRPGSHVVLRLERDQEPHQQGLLEAAMLAVHFSPARATGGGPVHVARVKEVKKPRGAKPGLVTLSGGRILEVRVQQAQLEVLLRRAQGRATPGHPQGPKAPGTTAG